MGDILYRAGRIVLQREEGPEGWGRTSDFTGRARRLKSVCFAPLYSVSGYQKKELKTLSLAVQAPPSKKEHKQQLFFFLNKTSVKCAKVIFSLPPYLWKE